MAEYFRRHIVRQHAAGRTQKSLLSAAASFEPCTCSRTSGFLNQQGRIHIAHQAKLPAHFFDPPSSIPLPAPEVNPIETEIFDRRQQELNVAVAMKKDRLAKASVLERSLDGFVPKFAGNQRTPPKPDHPHGIP